MSISIKEIRQNEERVIATLTKIIEVMNGLALKDSTASLQDILTTRNKMKFWDPEMINRFLITFKKEYAQQHPSFTDGIKVLDEVLIMGHENGLKNGRPFLLYKDNWTDDEFETMEESLWILVKKYDLVKDDLQARTLLSAFALIILFETRGDIAERRLKSWMKQYYDISKNEDVKEINEIVQRFFTIERRGTTGKSDAYHIRNGFAHGHFKLKGEDKIVLWDETTGNSKKELFRLEMKPGYVENFNVLLERKLFDRVIPTSNGNIWKIVPIVWTVGVLTS